MVNACQQDVLEGGWAETWAFITGKSLSVALAGESQ